MNRAVCPEAVTATPIDVEWERVPFVPVTTAVNDPGVVPPIVHVEVWDPVMLDGAHDVASPAGDETAVSETVPAKPPLNCREMVELADCPAANERLVGFAAIEKSGVGGAATVTPIEVVWTSEPLLPVMVTVYDPVADPVNVHVANPETDVGQSRTPR